MFDTRFTHEDYESVNLLYGQCTSFIPFHELYLLSMIILRKKCSDRNFQ